MSGLYLETDGATSRVPRRPKPIMRAALQRTGVPFSDFASATALFVLQTMYDAICLEVQ